MYRTQDNEVIPQGPVTFDTSGITSWVQSLVEAGVEATIAKALLDATRVKGVLTEAFNPSPALTRVQSMDSNQIIAILKEAAPVAGGVASDIVKALDALWNTVR